MYSNPVQNRIDDLVERWNLLRAGEAVRLVRVVHPKEEQDMVETFFTYLISEDSPTPDIPILFDRHFDAPESFTRYMLMQLHGLIGIWNRSVASRGVPSGGTDLSAEFAHGGGTGLSSGFTHGDDADLSDVIDWEPDFTYLPGESAAALFVRNFNDFASYLDLPEGVYLLGIFRVTYSKPREFSRWLYALLRSGISPKVRFLICDRADHHYFDRLVSSSGQMVQDLFPELNTEGMLFQLASMGDPTSPLVRYRMALVGLTEAVGKREPKSVRRHAKEALEIAQDQSKSDPLWFGQVLVIHTLLCSDQVGYKNWKKAIAHATDGVDQMELAVRQIKEESIGKKFIAQARMTRGGVYTADKQWPLAHGDFSIASVLYTETFDHILAIEAYRMNGYVLRKSWRRKESCQTLCEGFGVGRQVPPGMLVHTSFAGLAEAMLRTSYERHLDRDEVFRFLCEVYGKDWRHVLSKWNSPGTNGELLELSELVHSYT